MDEEGEKQGDEGYHQDSSQRPTLFLRPHESAHTSTLFSSPARHLTIELAISAASSIENT